MTSDFKTKKKLIRVDGALKEMVTIHDEDDNIVHKSVNHLMLEFHSRDLMQILVGASILAVPVAFTEETWNLGEILPLVNILSLAVLSMFFISVFVYYNSYTGRMKSHFFEFLKRVFSIYFFSLLVVSLLLTLIDRAPWSYDWLLALKRAILVSFPASMSAAVFDSIK